MKSFLFDIGNSGTAPIGFTARVLAKTEDDAVKTLKQALDNLNNEYAIFDDITDDEDDAPAPGLEYLRVYFNADVVTKDAIDEVEERDEDTDAEDAAS